MYILKATSYWVFAVWMLSILYALSYWLITHCGKYYPHLTEEENESQRTWHYYCSPVSSSTLFLDTCELHFSAMLILAVAISTLVSEAPTAVMWELLDRNTSFLVLNSPPFFPLSWSSWKPAWMWRFNVEPSWAEQLCWRVARPVSVFAWARIKTFLFEAIEMLKLLPQHSLANPD